MCLGEIARVEQVGPGRTASVRTGRGALDVSLLTLDGPVRPGDWLVCHSGFALSRVSPEEAAEAISLRTTIPTRKDPT